MNRYLIEVAYDGTAFHGSQIQPNANTVQGELNRALSLLMREKTSTFGASRTDEGVHALCNFFHFDSEKEVDVQLAFRLNGILPSSLAVVKIYQCKTPDFNARFAATSRRYRYKIYSKKNPFLQNRAMFFPFRLDFDLLDTAANLILQQKDFTSFSKKNTQTKTNFCEIKHCQWRQNAETIEFEIDGNRFLRGMVRGLVATQLHLAKGDFLLQDFTTIFEAKDCTKAFFDVPGYGLYLEKIFYPEGQFLPLLID